MAIVAFPVINDPRFPDKGPAKRNEIGLLVLNDFLHKLKGSQAPHQHDRHIHALSYVFGLFSEIGLALHLVNAGPELGASYPMPLNPGLISSASNPDSARCCAVRFPSRDSSPLGKESSTPISTRMG
jgi:hypothetical protein